MKMTDVDANTTGEEHDGMELTPPIDERSEEPIYVQLYRYLRQEIASGRIASGEKLPSVRRLAHRLGVSRTPVALAYEQLQAEGYVRSRPRSGLFAEAMPEGAKVQPTQMASTGDRGGRYVMDASGQTVRQAAPEAIDFGYGAVDWSRFPSAAWRKQLNRCLRPEDGRMFRYGDYAGEPELREQIASYLHRTRGVRCTPEAIVIGAGTYQSLDLVLQLIGDGEPLAIASEEAVNDGVARLFRRHRARVVPIRLESDGLRVDSLASCQAQACYVTPSHQFPMGMTLSAPKRAKLLQWAAECGAFLIENDYDGEFRYAGRPIPALQSLDHAGRVAYIGTFSRALTPSFRLSYAVLPPELLKRFRQGDHSYDQLASPLLQQAMALFMESGGFGRHMRAMRSLYQRKRDTLLRELHQAFDIGKAASIVGESSGLHMLLMMEEDADSRLEQSLVERAGLAGVNVYPVSRYWFRTEEAPRSTVLLGFGGLSEEQIAEGVRRLKKAWD